MGKLILDEVKDEDKGGQDKGKAFSSVDSY